MDPVFQAKIEALEKKIDAIYVSVEKTRKYMMWTAIITIAVIVLPLLGLVFVIPQFLSYYSNIGNISNLGM
jgi:hypothetical protein